MRQEAIEMDCAHGLQDREPPPQGWGVLGASATIIDIKQIRFQRNISRRLFMKAF